MSNISGVVSTDPGQKISMAMRLQKMCRIAPEDQVDYRRRRDVPDPIYHLSTEVTGIGRNHIKFFLGSMKKPRFSAFLVHPEKAATELEASLVAAKEIYGEDRIAVVFGDPSVGGGLFAYTDSVPESRRLESLGVTSFYNRRRPRCVMLLKSYLVAIGVAEAED